MADTTLAGMEDVERLRKLALFFDLVDAGKIKIERTDGKKSKPQSGKDEVQRDLRRIANYLEAALAAAPANAWATCPVTGSEHEWGSNGAQGVICLECGVWKRRLDAAVEKPEPAVE